MSSGSRSAAFAYRLINVMLLLFAVGLVVYVVSTVRGLVSGGSVPVHAELPEARVRSLSLPSGIRIVGDPKVTLEIRDASSKQQVLSAGLGLSSAAFPPFSLLLLGGPARSVRGGDPFGRANV